MTIQFKAKIQNGDKTNTDETITGNSLLFDLDQQRHVISNKIYWVDGVEWQSSDWEYIDINTLEIIKQ